MALNWADTLALEVLCRTQLSVHRIPWCARARNSVSTCGHHEMAQSQVVGGHVGRRAGVTPPAVSVHCGAYGTEASRGALPCSLAPAAGI